MSHDEPGPPKAHIEEVASSLLKLLSGNGRLPSVPLLSAVGTSARDVIAATLRRGQEAAADVTRRAAAAPATLRGDAVLGPWLARIRTGVSLQQDLRDLFEDILGRVSKGEAFLYPAPSTDTGVPPTLREDGTALSLVPHDDGTSSADVPATVAAIGDAFADGIRQAAERGGVIPARSADVTAWALTSLLMTLIMRSKEGEDVDQLIEVAVQAMAELLPAGDGSTTR